MSVTTKVSSRTEVSRTFHALLTHALEVPTSLETLSAQLQFSQHNVERVLPLPDEAPLATLIAFVEDYLQALPDLLDTLENAAHEQQMQWLVSPLIQKAQSYLHHAPVQALGVFGLLPRGYAIYRLLDEVNERCIQRLGLPVLPMDLTLSNLIVHTILGDDIGNPLDATANADAAVLLSRAYRGQSTRATCRQLPNWTQLATSASVPPLR